MIATFIVIGGVIIIVLLLCMWTDFTVYGPMLNEEDLNVFFERHGDKYVETTASEGLLHGFSFHLPFIATGSGIFWKWYINGYGRISRFSPWHTWLNDVYKNNYNPIKKTILDI